jgi:hypothetical protein|uniref:Uncharacterized protein n=1 Tax=Bacteriophage sp. TaxID=38018 RepID=A0A8D9PEQ4_9VIRU|nr:MAG TPA: hypothetical protein [Bacteriophage sp.]
MGSILTHTFGTYTVFRTIHSIYENTNEVAPCIVAFTPCDDMMLSTSIMEYELQDVFDTFDYLLKNQFDSFAKSAIYDGNSSPLNISELVDEVIEIMEKNYNFYRCSIEIVKPVENVYLEELTGIRSSAPALIRDMNKTKEVKKVNIKFVDGMVTDKDKAKAKKLEEEYNSKK